MPGSGTVRLGFRPALVGKNDVSTTQSFVHLVYVSGARSSQRPVAVVATAACAHRVGSSLPRPVISRLTDFRSPAAPSIKMMSPIGAPNQNRQ